MPSQTTTILLKCSMVDVPALNHVKLKSLYGSPGTLHKDVSGAGTKVSGKTVGGVGTATLTTLSSINNTSNATRNKNNPVPHEVRNYRLENFVRNPKGDCIQTPIRDTSFLGQESCLLAYLPACWLVGHVF
ncbi:hypothetical protein M0804_010712 [Polistes exclamans]|nr:hypothetical protein M0804_010712 [Polistes exclamans]